MVEGKKIFCLNTILNPVLQVEDIEEKDSLTLLVNKINNE